MKLFAKQDKNAKKPKAKKEKQAKPKKERKPREGGGLFGEAGFKVFMAAHCEKVILGLAVVIAGLMALMGLMKDSGIDANSTPDSLQAAAQNADRKMKAPKWDEDFREKRELDKNFAGDVDKALIPVSATEYQVANLLSTPLVAPRISRVDPQLLNVIDLQARAGYGALAMDSATAGFRGRLSDEDQQAIREFEQRPRGNRAHQDQKPLWDEFINVSSDARFVGKYFISVTGLIPYAEQMQLYRDSLASSSIYDAERDSPHYRFWVLDRAEVGQGTPKWQTNLTNANKLSSEEQTWAGQASDQVMNPIKDYVDERLTGPVPPLLYDRLPEIVWHSKLPRSHQETRRGPEAGRLPQAVPAGVDGGLIFDTPRRADSKTAEFERQDGPDEQDVTPYKLFRYVDTDVEVGKRYIYRVRLMLDDPNYQTRDSQYKRVSPRDRDTSVEERILAEKSSKDAYTKYAHREGARWTEFSEPSAPVQVSPGREVVVGSVVAPEKSNVRGIKGAYTKPGDEPTAQVVALLFDVMRAAILAGETEVRRGSMVNFIQEQIEVRLPSDDVLPLKDHPFKTNILVLGVRGGEKLGNTALRSTGELLVLDPTGRLQVLDEIAQKSKFERYYVEKKDETARPEEEETKSPRGRPSRREGGEGLLDRG